MKGEVIKSCCRMCGHGGCGVLVYVEDGRVVKIRGDPDHPISRGYVCCKCLASLELAYHPARLKHPLMRAGDRGSGRWRKVSWSEALDDIASRLKEIKERHGAESIAFLQGAERGFHHFLYRLANLLGTPNVATAGHICYVPRLAVSIITCGNLPLPDYEGGPKCVVVWGSNLLHSNADDRKAIQLLEALRRGAKLIVVDPRRTALTDRADLWLQLRPGTDAALALSMAHVIIAEGLYDRGFVEKHAHGFKEFAERVKDYAPEKVEGLTWVSAGLIREAARLYALSKPACIQWGVSIEHNLNATSTVHALLSLMAITGNLDVPGGNVLYSPPPVLPMSRFMLLDKLPESQRRKRLGADKYKLADMFQFVPPHALWRAILTGQPYPVKALLVFGSNPLISSEEALEAYEALRRLDFLVVVDLFMTPTAELADYVLPAATWLEYDYIADYWKRHGYVFAQRKVIDPPGECWPDHKIINELGRRLGFSEYFWDDVNQALDYILSPSGLTWERFKELGFLKGRLEYRKYEKAGFRTPTGKFELYSTVLKKLGYDPLPSYVEPPETPLSNPKLAEEYPLILMNGARFIAFFHSEHRSISSLRKLRPDPLLEVHPKTAEKLGLSDGGWAYVETPRGRVRMKVKVTDRVHPLCVHADHGWWFPEEGGPCYGWRRSNVNLLTSNKPPHDPCFGSTNVRVSLCRIRPAS